jgi:hypothetical protein
MPLNSDSVTILRSFSGQPQTKTLNSGGVIAVEQRTKYFVGDEQPVHDLRSFAAALEAASLDPAQCVVRGRIADTANRARMLRRSKARLAKPATATTPAEAAVAATLIEVPRRWVLFDLDGAPLPPGFDQFASPAATVALAIGQLPAAFHGAACWYQFTSSAGIKPGLRIRLGFWLDRPLGESELKGWLGQRPGLDRSVFRTSQPIYIAKPVLAGGASDPLEGRCERSGLIAGKIDPVVVPEISAPVRQTTTTSHGTPAAASVEEALAAIEDSPGGCYQAMVSAVSVYFRRNRAGANPTTIKALIERRASEVKWTTHSEDYVRQKLEQLPELIIWVQEQQQASEERSGEAFLDTTSLRPDNSVTLDAGRSHLDAAVDEFFGAVVPEGRALRTSHALALAGYEAAQLERPGAEAVELPGDADAVFADAPDPQDAPPSPRYPQHGIKITAGAGKTHAAEKRIIADTKTGSAKFIIAVPTQDKAAEVAADIAKLGGKSEIWRGLERPDPDAPGARMCPRHETVAGIRKAGGGVATLCGSAERGFCPFHPAVAAVGASCGYQQQLGKRSHIWIAPTALLFQEMPAAMRDADALIVDEAVNIDGHPDKLTVPELMAERKKPWTLTNHILPRIGRALATVAPGAFLPRAALVAEGINAKVCRIAATCEVADYQGVAKAIDPQASDEWNLASAEIHGEAHRLVTLRIAFWDELAAFLDGPEPTAPRLRMLVGGAIQIDRLRGVRAEWLERPVLHLDATLDEHMARVWLPRLEMKADIKVKSGAGAKVRQVTDQAVSYSHIIPGAGGVKEGSEKYRTQTNWMHKLMRRLEVACAAAREQNGAAGCNAPQALERQMLEVWKAWGTKPTNLLLGHFNALRGVNAFEHVVEHVVISRPLPPPADVEAIYRLRFNRHPKPSLHGAPFPTRAAELRSTGNDRIAVEEQPYHPDPNCDRILQQITGAEVTQAVHRPRPVRRGVDDPLLITIVTNTVTDRAIDTAVVLADWVQEADPVRVLLSRGFWPSSWAGRQAVLRDMYPTEGAARVDFSRLPAADTGEGGDSKSVQMPYKKEGGGLYKAFVRYSRSEWPEYRCRAAGARKSHLVRIDPALHPDANASWKAVLRAPIDSFEAIKAVKAKRAAPLLSPAAVLPAGPSLQTDILGTRSSGHDPAPQTACRRWATKWPRASAPPEPVFTVDDLRARAGISRGTLRAVMERGCYRRLHGEARERAELEWIMKTVGREKLASIARDMRQAAAMTVQPVCRGSRKFAAIARDMRQAAA